MAKEFIRKREECLLASSTTSPASNRRRSLAFKSEAKLAASVVLARGNVSRLLSTRCEASLRAILDERAAGSLGLLSAVEITEVVEFPAP